MEDGVNKEDKMEIQVFLMRKYKGNRVGRIRGKIEWMISHFLPPVNELWQYDYSKDTKETVVVIPITLKLHTKEDHPFLGFSSGEYGDKEVAVLLDDETGSALLRELAQDKVN